MRRRRRSLGLSSDVKCPLTEAHAKLTNLKYNMIANLVKPEFTVEDLYKWLWPESMLEILRAAAPYAARHYGYCQGHVAIPHTDRAVRFQISINKDKMVCPRELNEAITPQVGKDNGITDAIRTGFDIAERFMKVKKVVAWLEKNATAGAIRYYWPTALSLVEDNHPIQQATNQRYREPPGVASMIPLFRETSTLVAQALMLPKVEQQSRILFMVFLPDGDSWQMI